MREQRNARFTEQQMTKPVNDRQADRKTKQQNDRKT